MHRLLPILLLLPARLLANEEPACSLESYSVPAAIWLKVPAAMREDAPRLRDTLIAQLPKGTVRLVDRIGSSSQSSQRTTVAALEEHILPSEFAATEDAIVPVAWETRETGSTLEFDANFRESTRLTYTRLGPGSSPVPLLKRGQRLDMERTAYPVFPKVRLELVAPVAPVSLAAIVPDPSPGLREDRLLVCFFVTNPVPEVEDPAKRAPGYLLELIGLRGTTRAAKPPPEQMLKNLLRRSDAHVFTIGTTQAPSSRASLDAVREIRFASDAVKSPIGPVPSGLQTASPGTLLKSQLGPLTDGTLSALIQVDHDLRDPVLPSVPGKGEELIDKDRLLYVMQMRFRGDLAPDGWTLLDEKPFSDALGPDDRETKGESLYLFGRVSVGR